MTDRKGTDRIIESVNVQVRHDFSGYLEKKGREKVKTWHKRFFVWDSDVKTVTYYTKHDMKELKGCFPLTGLFLLPNRSGKKKNRFDLANDCEILNVCAPDALTKKKWIEVIGSTSGIMPGRLSDHPEPKVVAYGNGLSAEELMEVEGESAFRASSWKRGGQFLDDEESGDDQIGGGVEEGGDGVEEEKNTSQIQLNFADQRSVVIGPGMVSSVKHIKQFMEDELRIKSTHVTLFKVGSTVEQKNATAVKDIGTQFAVLLRSRAAAAGMTDKESLGFILGMLSITQQSITTLSIPWCGHSCLTVLNLSDCKIKELPQEIRHFMALETLYLNGNLMKALPPSLCECISLHTIGLANQGGKLKAFPAAFTRCETLETISLGGNLIERIDPKVLEPLSLLRSVYLVGNKIPDDPPAGRPMWKLELERQHPKCVFLY
jgi:hypothetical protein